MSHVEFLGAPGSGKSSIYRAVLSRESGVLGLEEAVRTSLRATARDPITRLAAGLSRSAESRLWRAVYGRSPDRFQGLTEFARAHPDVLAAVSEAIPGMHDDGAEEGLGWVLNLMARYQVATRITGRRLLVDEGFYQRAVVLFAYPFSESSVSTLDAYLDAAPAPRLVVYVDAPPEVCRQRLTTRGWSRRVAEGERNSFLVDTFRVVELAREHAEKRAATLIVDGTEPVEHNASLVIEHLRVGSEDPS